MSSGKLFNFSVVSVEIFHNYIVNLDAKKAIGHDGLNAKFLKLCGFHIAKPYCALFNQYVSKSIFPADMKLAEISPMLKKWQFGQRKLQIGEYTNGHVQSFRIYTFGSDDNVF